jgi:hypothetical protein
MNVAEARDIAQQWVMEQSTTIPGLHGAYLAGSASELSNDAPLPATSDFDVNLVLAGSDPPKRAGKLLYRDVLLDITFLPLDRLRSADLVLSDYHLAGGFRTPSVMLDPSGQLTALQQAVARDFARRRWVERRCAHARDRVLEQLASLNPAASFPDQVTGWLFPTGVLTHVLLVAGLKNPTVRRRYVATRELLTEYGHHELYEALLEVLGCAHMSREGVERHLAALEQAFVAAAAVNKSPSPFASDISDLARPIAIDGSRELIARGCHREAVFWIAVTYSRCEQIFQQAGPAMQDRFEPGYRQLLGELGIRSSADLRQRGDRVLELLPRVWRVAEDIIAANPESEDEVQFSTAFTTPPGRE